FGRCVDFIPSVLVARRLDGTLKFAIGPTIATRQSVLEKIDGLNNVCDRIGSDYHIGNMIANAGYRVELSDYILENDCEKETFSSVFKRELRWARTIRINRGSQYYGMAFCYGTVYSLFLLLLSGFSAWAIAVCAVTFAVRLMQVALSIWSLKSPKLLQWLWIVPMRDVMSFAVWLGGCFGRRVYWRGRFLEIGVKGRLSESQS
ncbi:MAG: glycosyltransferase family 2 protein, partial [Chroococcales cyanobacterium]